MAVSDFVGTPYSKNGVKQIVIRSCEHLWFADNFSPAATGAGSSIFTIMHGKGAKGSGIDTVLKALRVAAGDYKDFRLIVYNSFTESFDGYGEYCYIFRR